MTLDQLEPGEKALIVGVETYDKSTFKAMTLGLVEGSIVGCKSKLYTSMEVDIYGTGFAISNQTAKRIIVEKLADESLVD